MVFGFVNAVVELAHIRYFGYQMKLSITPITTIEECRIIEELQAEIWQSTDLEVAPDHLIWTIAKEGGVVLLARTEAGEAVGFGYGFLGFTKDQHLKLASHQVGVSPAYQNENVGYQIKLAQREVALRMGLDLITWTFDPLQGRNANLNLRKLGVVCNTYLPNLYGTMRDELNKGLPSDRFRVDWWIASNRVAQRIDQQIIPVIDETKHHILNPSTIVAENIAEPSATFSLGDEATYLVEMPVNISYLRKTAPDVALQWRTQTREIFQTAFEQNYVVTDMLHRGNRNYFLLTKDWQKD